MVNVASAKGAAPALSKALASNPTNAGTVKATKDRGLRDEILGSGDVGGGASVASGTSDPTLGGGAASGGTSDPTLSGGGLSDPNLGGATSSDPTLGGSGLSDPTLAGGDPTGTGTNNPPVGTISDTVTLPPAAGSTSPTTGSGASSGNAMASGEPDPKRDAITPEGPAIGYKGYKFDPNTNTVTVPVKIPVEGVPVNLGSVSFAPNSTVISPNLPSGMNTMLNALGVPHEITIPYGYRDYYNGVLVPLYNNFRDFINTGNNMRYWQYFADPFGTGVYGGGN